MSKKIAVILIAHGSKRSESNDEFIRLAKKIKEEDTHFDEVEYAFLELAQPSIEDTIDKMHQMKMDKVYLYPYFLNSGKHVAIDIPNIAREMQIGIEDMKIEVLNHFGESKSIAKIISHDLKSLSF
ncbi:MAG: CbiX/SirB N-terminal domain-containing protein [Sulfurimonas sp.]|uniref:sirohydrochlorin chelatase n=1 Tax=Sulfurimonas sp. TaxID=2022749 RepID=UPI0025F0B031|nr:CbiX/SirB N-terminal domain-containing protein [Sulfurimonas sp.]MCK9491114.1 CbiX/SirB N-terminal domain-containing protein [Sulfurimonas sp.]